MKFKHSHVALALAATIGIGGCFGGGVTKPDIPDVVLPPPAAPTIDVEVTGNVVDSRTGAVVTGATLTFLNGGAATIETRLLDDDFTRVSELTSADGSFAFGYDDNTSIDSVTILVEADGYLAQTIVFDIAGAADENTLSFRLVSETTPGIAVIKETAAVTAGTVATEVVIAAATTSGASTVTLPAGVVLQDASGNPVSSGDVTLQVIAIDSDDDGADAVSVAELLQAGLQDSTSVEVFAPVAATTVNFFDASGNQIKRFSTPITITMNIPASRGVAEGDVLTLKSYDEETGLWADETATVLVGAQMGDFFPGTFQIDHLTTFVAGSLVANDKCEVTSTVNLTGDAVVAGLVLNMTRSISGNVTLPLTAGQATVTFADTQSASETATITVTDAATNTWGQVTGAAICGTVNLGLSAPGTTVSENLNITATCTGDDTVFTPDTNAVVTYRQAETQDAFVTASHVSNGDFLLTELVSGATYDVNVNSGIAGVPDFSVQILADGNDEVAPIVYDCNAGTGTGGTGGTGGGGI